MTKHRVQADGTIRDSANWQRGIPVTAYMKSGWRHFLDWWIGHRAILQGEDTPFVRDTMEEALCALLFNVMGYLHEHLKRQADLRRKS